MNTQDGAVEIEKFTRADGMPATECNGGSQPSAGRLPDGNLCFPTTEGLAVIPSEKSNHSVSPPPARVEEIPADGLTLGPGPVIEVPAGTHRLEIRYTGLLLVDPARVRFRYKMVGLDRAIAFSPTGKD